MNRPDADAAEPAPVAGLALDEPLEDPLVVGRGMPMPWSVDGDLDPAPRPRWPRDVTVPPSGEYLNAFSSSWPTMMSVAIGSPLRRGQPVRDVGRTGCA